MLECYRVGLIHWQLMDDIQSLGLCYLDDENVTCETLSYSGGFLASHWIRSFSATLLSPIARICHGGTQNMFCRKRTEHLIRVRFSSGIEVCHRCKIRVFCSQVIRLHRRLSENYLDLNRAASCRSV